MSAAEELVHDLADQNFKGGGAGKPGAPQHAGLGVGVEAADGKALLPQTRRHAPHQRGRAAQLLGADRRVAHVQTNGVMPLGEYADCGLLLTGDAGQRVHVHAAGQAPAVLVVGVVAAQLRAARRAENMQLVPLLRVKALAIAPDHRLNPPVDILEVVLAVYGAQRPVKLSVLQRAQQFLCLHGVPPFFLFLNQTLKRK